VSRRRFWLFGFMFRSDIESEGENSVCSLILPVAILDYVGKGNKP
jgi:hypothetical protein